MKKNTNTSILLAAVIALFTYNVSSQQIDENTLVINKYFQNVNAEETLPLLTNISQTQENLNTQNNIELSILQAGNYNIVNINSTVNSQNINQLGNSNSYEFISFYGRNDLNFEAQQIGNNNFIQVLGENSIINNMKIIQKSDFKTITITNY
jgi:hypothetical protein